MTANQLVPAAQYLRMSKDDQRHSIPFQQSTIREYALRHGFVVRRTYADPGRTGVLIRRRKGLSQLLLDVVGGRADFQAVLVYDVSRWGRFQNPDEAAHYEFICAHAGIPVHYCAEQFSNDGSMQSSLMKSLKRTMAGEFSRELSGKIYDALKRHASEGFHAGGIAPYGLERMLLSASGRRNRILRLGELKNIKNERVVLVPGKKYEIERVREIFSLCAERHMTCQEIANELNSSGRSHRGKAWDACSVIRILQAPQYLGLNVWGRRARKLYGRCVVLPRESWVINKAPFDPIVSQETWDKAHRTLARNRRNLRTEDVLLFKLKQILARQGKLTAVCIDRSQRVGGTSTYQKRFGSLLRAYEKVGFRPSAKVYAQSEHIRAALALHKEVLYTIQELFPSEIRVVRSAEEHKAFVEVDGRFRVSVHVCGKQYRVGRGGLAWVLRLLPRERQHLALICPLDSEWKTVVGYFLVRPLGDSITAYRSFYDTAWLTAFGVELKTLRGFCGAVRKIALEVDKR